jgi:hypothetical protein
MLKLSDMNGNEVNIGDKIIFAGRLRRGRGGQALIEATLTGFNGRVRQTAETRGRFYVTVNNINGKKPEDCGKPNFYGKTTRTLTTKNFRKVA